MTDERSHRHDNVDEAAAAYRRRAAMLGLNDYVGAPRPTGQRTDEELRTQFYAIFDRSVSENVFYEAFPIPDDIGDELATLQRRAREGTLDAMDHTEQARELLGTAWIAHRRAAGD